MSLDLPDKEDTREDSNYLQRDHAAITLRGILFKCLQNAQFWELHNVRGSCLVGCLDVDLSRINSCISIICIEPDYTALFLLFSRRWSRVACAHCDGSERAHSCM